MNQTKSVFLNKLVELMIQSLTHLSPPTGVNNLISNTQTDCLKRTNTIHVQNQIYVPELTVVQFTFG